MTTRAAVVAEALTWLNTPYHHMGRVKGRRGGVDCAQILIAVYSAVGIIPEFDYGYYAPDWHLHRDEERYLNEIIKHARPTATPGPGDVLLFRFGRTVSHSAIVIDGPLVIHALMGKGVILSELGDADLDRPPAACYTMWSD